MPLAKAGGLGFANQLSLVRLGWACGGAVRVTQRVIGREPVFGNEVSFLAD